MEIDAVLSLAIEIADALDAAHAKGIVHRVESKFDPFRTTQLRVRTFDFPLWLKYPFPNTGG